MNDLGKIFEFVRLVDICAREAAFALKASEENLPRERCPGLSPGGAERVATSRNIGVDVSPISVRMLSQRHH